MIHNANIEICKSVVDDVNAILNSGKIQPTAEDIMFAFTASFANGYEADIKLVNGNPPYIDPVLFDSNGCELSVISADAETINGEYHWFVGNDEYRLCVIGK